MRPADERFRACSSVSSAFLAVVLVLVIVAGMTQREDPGEERDKREESAERATSVVPDETRLPEIDGTSEAAAPTGRRPLIPFQEG